MNRTPARAVSLAATLVASFSLVACYQYSEYAPRIDMEFKPGAPVVSTGLEFAPDAKSKSAFSAPEVAEQIAFINATLRELNMSSVSPNSSNAQNRRFSVFLPHRLFYSDLESVLDRVRVSSLVASAEWTAPPLEVAHDHPKYMPAPCSNFNYAQAQINECEAAAAQPKMAQPHPKTMQAAASCVPYNYAQAQINECPNPAEK